MARDDWTLTGLSYEQLSTEEIEWVRSWLARWANPVTRFVYSATESLDVAQLVTRETFMRLFALHRRWPDQAYTPDGLFTSALAIVRRRRWRGSALARLKPYARVNRLSPSERECVWLFCYGEMTEREIARIRLSTDQEVISILQRARSKMSSEMTAQAHVWRADEERRLWASLGLTPANPDIRFDSSWSSSMSTNLPKLAWPVYLRWGAGGLVLVAVGIAVLQAVVHRNTPAVPNVTVKLTQSPVRLAVAPHLTLSKVGQGVRGSLPLSGVAMTGSSSGYAISGSNLVGTDNRGRSWNVLRGISGSVSMIDVLGRATAYVVAQQCATAGAGCDSLWVTNDRGSHWRKLYTSPGTILTIDFANHRYGWAVARPSKNGRTKLLGTTDGGVVWRTLTFPGSLSGSTPSLSFISDRQGWLLVGASSHGGTQEKVLYDTVDGGKTWMKLTAVSTHPSTTGLLQGLPLAGAVQATGGMAFVSPSRGFLVLTNIGLFVTSDGGRSWKPISALDRRQEGIWPTTPGQGAVGFWSHESGFVVLTAKTGEPLVYVTLDAGTHWVRVFPRILPSWEVSMPKSSPWYGYGDLAGGPAQLLQTSANDGRSWTVIGALPRDTFKVEEFAAGSLIAATYRGFDVSVNGGRTWRPGVLPHHTGDVSMVSFYSLSGGWAYVNGEGLFSTSDGGHSWHRLQRISHIPFFFPSSWVALSPKVAIVLARSRSLPPPGTSTSVHVSPATGDTLWITHNGGKRWFQYSIPDGQTALGIAANGSVVLVWSHRYFWVQSGSGRQCIPYRWPVGESLEAVSLISPESYVATVSSKAGNVQMLTKDGGRTWTPLG